MLKLPKSITAAVHMDIRFTLPVRATVHADGANRVRLVYRTRRLRFRLWCVRVFVRVVAFACGADSVQARTMPVVATSPSPVAADDPRRRVLDDLAAKADRDDAAQTGPLSAAAAYANHADQVAANAGGNGDGQVDVEAEK